jgi:hypothetical protein
VQEVAVEEPIEDLFTEEDLTVEDINKINAMQFKKIMEERNRVSQS